MAWWPPRRKERFHILVWSWSCVLKVSAHCVLVTSAETPLVQHLSASGCQLGEWGQPWHHSGVSAGGFISECCGIFPPCCRSAGWYHLGRVRTCVRHLRPTLLLSDPIRLHGNVPTEDWDWEMSHVLCVCSAASAFYSAWILEELDGSLHLAEQIPSGCSGLIQHLAAVQTRAPSPVHGGSCCNGNATPALWKCLMRECWRRSG